MQLSGGFPSLLKVVGQWWMLTADRPGEPDIWLSQLLDHPAIQHRLERMWHGLTQEEKLTLSEIQRQQIGRTTAERRARAEAQPPGQLQGRTLTVVEGLVQKGCCVRDAGVWRVNGLLLEAFVARLTGRIRGRIWLDQSTQTLYQGQQPIDELTPLEFSILRFLVAQPRMRHTSDTIIDNTWPVGDNRDAVTPNNLQVHISSIRKKVEPDPAMPRFLVTWHGRPGGYQFFPEGKPE